MEKRNKNLDFLIRKIPKNRITLLQGGTRSGKTYAVIHWIIRYCLKYENLGTEIDIVRDTFTALKATAWHDFEKELIRLKLYKNVDHNKSSNKYVLFGNTINYYGADTPDKIHGRSRDILWVNEAHQFPGKTIDQLFPRTRHRIICDYNPAIGLGHWLEPYIIKNPPLITTYKDNPYLTIDQIREIEDRQTNKFWWTVYGTGHRARREGVVYDNWREGNFDNTLSYCYALDWGYSPDPIAMIKIAVDNGRKKIYLKEIIYDSEINDVTGALKARGILPHELIICDTNEPRTKQAVKNEGFNIQNAVKQMIVQDIREIKNYEIIVEKGSSNIIMELENYTWNDKKSSTPIGEFNHSLDAMRYGFNRLVRKVNYSMHGQNRVI